MSNKVKIYLNEKDIEYGMPWSGGACPVARAIVRHFEEIGHQIPIQISVTNDVFINYGFSRSLINLPRSARRFISRFDQRKPVKPFNFLMEF